MDSTDEKNIEALRLLRERAMRITEALYRTTDLFSDVEPLKWSLRDTAIKILNTVSDIGEHPSYQELRSAQTLEKTIDTLCYKLDLAAGGTFVARSNFDVLEREYKALGANIGNINFFGIPLLAENSLQNKVMAIMEPELSDKQITDVQNNTMSDTIVHNEDKTHSEQSSNIAVQVRSQMRSKHTTSHKPHNISAPSDRQSTILGFIKERGPSSVGDLTKILGTSLSEKTIQRDLNALAEAGILKREGEKRWRRYFL